MRLSAYARLYRVKDWLHFLPLPLAGWAADPARGGAGTLVGGVVAWSLGLAYASCINQAFDDRLDRLARAKNPVGPAFDRRQAVRMSLPPLVGCLVVLALFAPVGLVAGVALLVAATLYSAPPRLKRYPVLGTLWNLAVALPGFFFAGRPPVLDLPLRPLVGVFAVLLLGSQLIHEAQDRDDDAAGGVRTVATQAGRRAALWTALAFVVATPPFAWWLAAGSERRGVIVAMSVVFSLVCGAWLGPRVRSDDAAELKRLRLRYRYAAVALGGALYAALRF